MSVCDKKFSLISSEQSITFHQWTEPYCTHVSCSAARRWTWLLSGQDKSSLYIRSLNERKKREWISHPSHLPLLEYKPVPSFFFVLKKKKKGHFFILEPIDAVAACSPSLLGASMRDRLLTLRTESSRCCSETSFLSPRLLLLFVYSSRIQTPSPSLL